MEVSFPHTASFQAFLRRQKPHETSSCKHICTEVYSIGASCLLMSWMRKIAIMHASQFPDYVGQTRMAECLQFVRTIQLTATFNLKIFEASKRGTVDAFCSNSSPLCCLSLTLVATVLSVAHSLSMAHPEDERKHTSASFSISRCGTQFRQGNCVQLVNL